MNKQKICFIMCSNDEVLEKECRYYIEQLIVPTDMQVEVLVIRDAESMTSGYNKAMKKTDAKYKVYLHQDVLLINRNFLVDIVSLFERHPEIGMLGLVGNQSLAKDGCPWSDGMHRRIGELYSDLIYQKEYCVFSKIEGEYQEAVVLDGLLMATQYDLSWREDLFQGWDFYDCSQSLEFWRAGYKVVVPHMNHPWCLHDNDIVNLKNYEKWRQIFEKEYQDDYMNWTPEGIHIKKEKNKERKVIYQIFSGKESVMGFPYPPVYMEKEIDYICFTDSRDITSKYWNMEYLKELREEDIKGVLADYDMYYRIEENQIVIGDVFTEKEQEYYPVVTVPSLHDIPNVDFDESKVIPTKDADGNYYYTKNPIYRGGKYDGRELLLTIGVPVSNQIDTIDRCLSHIKPLLEYLDAELLVIDTGSTDGTIEICKSYGARIVKFPWCNNMSAARNQGIYHAKGEWYMSIDDDEWFENVDDILSFFRSGNYKNYNIATYIQRNYYSMSGETYSDNHTLRMAKIVPELHFEGRIHDALMISKKGKGCQLFSIAHHYGFVNDNEKRMREKYIRNASSLLCDIYEYPMDLRYNFQFANELNAAKEYSLAWIFSFRGLSIEREITDIYYGKTHAANLIATLYNATDRRLFAVVKLLKKQYQYTLAEEAFFHFVQADLGLRFGYSAKEVIKHYIKYEEYRKKFDNNPNESLRLTFAGLHTCTNKQYITDAHTIAFCAYVQLQEEKRALDKLEEIDFELIYDQKQSFCQSFIIASDMVYQAVYERLSQLQCELWIDEIFTAFFASWQEELIQERQLNRLSDLLKKLSIDRLYQYILQDSNMQSDVLLNIFYNRAMNMEISASNIQECYFYSQVLQRKLCKPMQDEEHLEMFLQYVQLTGIYAQKYYCAELLKDRGNMAIAGEVRAAYEIYLALQGTQADKEAITHLKYALEAFPGFRKEIQKLLDMLVQIKGY